MLPKQFLKLHYVVLSNFGLWGALSKSGPGGPKGLIKKRLLWKVLGLPPKHFLKLHYVVLSNFGLIAAPPYCLAPLHYTAEYSVVRHSSLCAGCVTSTVREGVTFKKEQNNLGQRGGGGSDPNPSFCSEFPFLEATNLASPYFKTCVTVKIWLNLMHTNLISRLIHATVPVPGGGEWVVLGERKICFTKNVYIVILGWFGDPKQFCQSMWGGGRTVYFPLPNIARSVLVTNGD